MTMVAAHFSQQRWRIHARRTFAFALATCAGITFGARSARADDLAAVYQDVKPSVVYIVSTLSDGVTSGSGFVIASGDASSSIVTASHVVEGAVKIDVILDSDPKRRYEATLLKRDHVRDIAELSIPLGHRVALKLQNASGIREGMSVAAIGYPRAVKKFEQLMGDDLRPSVHSGIVSAVRVRGEIIQFDAETDHGDSGGPVIDVKTGLVVGAVRGSLLDQSYLSAGLETLPGSNFALSAPSIATIVGDVPNVSAKNKVNDRAESAKLSMGSAPEPSRPRNSNAAGASSSAEYRVGFAAPRYDDPVVDATAARLTTRLSKRFTSGNEVYVVPITPGIAEASNFKLATYCDDTRLNAVIAPYARVGVTQPAPEGAAGGRKVFVTLGLRVSDCSGKPFFLAEKTTRQAIALTTRSQDRDVTDIFDGMLDDLVRDFDRFKDAHAAAWMSLLKVGFAVSPEREYHALIGIEWQKDSGDYRVTTVYPDGPGADAGLRPGDAIVAIDGKPTKGLSLDDIWSMLDGPARKVSVQRPGGLTLLLVQPKKYAALEESLKR